MEASKKYTLDKSDLGKIGTGALIAVGGALVTYSAEIVVQIDFGTWTPIIVSISSILINAARKYLAGYEVVDGGRG